MPKRRYLLWLLVGALTSVQAAGPDTVGSGAVDPCNSEVTVNAGVVLVCPQGDGDPLTAPVGGGNSKISLTVKDNFVQGVGGIPASDMWLIGCSDGLVLCGGSTASKADAPTNAMGETTFSNEPNAGGCDTGVYVIVQGVVMADPDNNCVPKCYPVQARSPDYKSAGAPGPPACAGDNRCPDSKVTNADFSWFVTHYPTAANPNAAYHACADYAAPLGNPITLADYAKFTIHFAGAAHKCSI